MQALKVPTNRTDALPAKAGPTTLAGLTLALYATKLFISHRCL
jgi:hypothetical protein